MDIISFARYRERRTPLAYPKLRPDYRRARLLSFLKLSGTWPHINVATLAARPLDEQLDIVRRTLHSALTVQKVQRRFNAAYCAWQDRGGPMPEWLWAYDLNFHAAVEAVCHHEEALYHKLLSRTAWSDDVIGLQVDAVYADDLQKALSATLRGVHRSLGSCLNEMEARA